MPTSNDNTRKVQKAAAECLRRAKALIPDREHWWRGHGLRYCPVTTHCPVTALLNAVPSNRVYLDYRTFFETAIGTVDIAHWNDAPERTLADVHAAFDRAIALAEANQ